jgi:hypothetical protein
MVKVPVADFTPDLHPHESTTVSWSARDCWALDPV